VKISKIIPTQNEAKTLWQFKVVLMDGEKESALVCRAEELMKAAREDGEARLRGALRTIGRARSALDRRDYAAAETALETLNRPYAPPQARAGR